jgi:hypothetical protein
MHLYWDQNTKQLAIFRKACYQIADADDRVPYPLYGHGGVLRLVESYEANAGYIAAPKWPSNDKEMLDLQMACPLVKSYFVELQDSGQDTLIKHGRLLYQPKYAVIHGEESISMRGALRAKSYQPTAESNTGDYEIKDTEAFNNPVVLPLALREPLMRFLHDENAHPGSTRLLASCKLKYWWRGLTTYVNEYASKCQHCKKRNLSHKVAVPPLQRYPGVSRPFQRCHMDLIELPLTPSKYRYILVVKCALTKWIEMKPLRSKEAKEIAEALFDEVFCRHGSIETIVSDNGTEFVNHTMKQFHELLLTKRLTTTPYNPQSNGAVEIFNRTLADMLCAYVNAN